ncbi:MULTISPECIES: TetR/AcrR family transcriptional regulator [Pseudonocardia]|uniref:Bacterial regulatory protein n=2 Tax=Pseudonocardia TaxID=1847 RepID=A0A1Y2N313_PSEAH|nr:MULTISPECIES: TetR/AcrR family transcriptional regulator [Pseudonocardia]OSY41820.1 Bacterial regulatory protein [Pseudonocardia autotrophica]TDN71128.1 TetR family transcriptional regulator [Pseudonocardia autotrophica]BBG01798.1 TetR family transcriptional regulator [Pseudonocardia autotrophica]GEC26253.1 TetR family transcriptional regulator [Pseudonocardia saturnea]
MSSRFPAQRRRQVLDAARALVAERGFEVTTVEAVAAATRTSKATLYRQWGDKASLVVEAVSAGSGIAIGRIDTGTLAGDLGAVADMLAERASVNVPIVLGIARAGQRDPALLAALSARLLPEIDALRAIVTRAVVRGELPAEPPAARYLQHMLTGALLAPSLLEGRAGAVDARHLHDYLAAVVLPALGSGQPGRYQAGPVAD